MFPGQLTAQGADLHTHPQLCLIVPFHTLPGQRRQDTETPADSAWTDAPLKALQTQAWVRTTAA